MNTKLIKYKFHDAQVGNLKKCQISNSNNLFEAIDLGHQPPCDSLLNKTSIDEPEISYPLKLNICPESGIAQLSYVVDGKLVYPKDYPYRSGISKPLVDYQQSFAKSILKDYKFKTGSLVVDIGSNDGTLLTGFKKLNMSVLGVEPTNMSIIAKNNKIDTIQDFFNEKVANNIVEQFGKAKIITMTNVFAHMSSLGQVMRGLKILLDKDGIFITESQYLLDVLEKNQFDGIYHEHVRTYSLKSLVKLFEMYEMDIFNVSRAERYGGNLRVYVSAKGKFKINNSVDDLLKLELEKKLFDPITWSKFRNRVNQNRNKFLQLIAEIKSNNKTIAADSCPGRGTVLINYYGITKETIPYVAQLSNSEKVGQFIPGTHIPIVDNSIILKDEPDYIIILAWHYSDYIIKEWKKKGIKSKFILPLPKFQIV